MKKRIAVAIMILLLSMLPITVFAAQKGTIKGTSVNVRKDAGTSYDKLCSLDAGQDLSVGKSKKDANGNVWYKVTFTKDEKKVKGYVISNYIEIAETEQAGDNAQTTVGGEVATQTTQAEGDQVAPEQTSASQTTATTTQKGTINGTNVNIRKSAVSGSVIAKLSSKKSVTIKKEKKAKDGNVWYYISFKLDGKTKKGWVRSDFVKWKEAATQTPAPQTTEAEQTTAEQTTAEQTPSQPTSDTKATTKTKKGTMKADNVRMRKSPVSGKVICQLKKGTSVTIKSSKKGSDGKKWYKITAKYNGKKKTGYVRSDFVKVKKTTKKEETKAEETPENQEQQEQPVDDVVVLSDEEFAKDIEAQGFPSSYHAALKALHTAHPKWQFKAVKTGLSWADVIAAESKVGKNLVSKNAIVSWKSLETTAYNWKTNKWYTFDGGSWAAASTELIQYYIDPRNFLDEESVFQFESLEFHNYHTKEGVAKLLENSFMKDSFTEPDGSTASYADSFLSIGKEMGINPYHLAARCYQEQGKGKSDSISGVVKGYENIFNYYNIGAYASGGNSPTKQGLIYASKSVEGDTNYGRPWNTRYKSLWGGANYLAQKYIKLNQNTLYFQKFNVVNTKNGVYKHQYMTNVQAAASEATKMSKAYTDKEIGLVFNIPVYENMPDAIAAKPSANVNPNNYLASITVKDKEMVVEGDEAVIKDVEQALTPAFDGATDNYKVQIDSEVETITVEATAVATTSTVTGTGEIQMSSDETTKEVQITCFAENGVGKTYTVTLERKAE